MEVGSRSCCRPHNAVKSDTANAVGIKRESIRTALERLIADADVIDDSGRPRLTDPIFELWLQTAGSFQRPVQPDPNRAVAIARSAVWSQLEPLLA